MSENALSPLPYINRGINRSDIPEGKAPFEPFEVQNLWYFLDERTNLYGPYDSAGYAETIMRRIQLTDQVAAESAAHGEYFRSTHCKICDALDDCNEYSYCQECWEDSLEREDF